MYPCVYIYLYLSFVFPSHLQVPCRYFTPKYLSMHVLNKNSLLYYHHSIITVRK